MRVGNLLRDSGDTRPDDSGQLRRLQADRHHRPEGTVVNALPPAPVVGRNAITHTVVNSLMMALSQVVPERITAAYYGMSNVYILAGDRRR